MASSRVWTLKYYYPLRGWQHFLIFVIQVCSLVSDKVTAVNFTDCSVATLEYFKEKEYRSSKDGDFADNKL